MAERAGNTVSAAVAGDAAMGDSDRFGRRDHGWGDSKARCGGQSSTDIPSCQRKLASPAARDPRFRWGEDEGWRDNQTILDSSEERRVGKEGVSTFRSRWVAYN